MATTVQQCHRPPQAKTLDQLQSNSGEPFTGVVLGASLRQAYGRKEFDVQRLARSRDSAKPGMASPNRYVR